MSFFSSTRAALAVLLFAVIAFWSGTARADDDEASPPYEADDTVVMTNGKEVRGHVVLEVARTLLCIWLEDGKVITIPWSEIDHVTYAPAKSAAPRVLEPTPPASDDHENDIPMDDDGANDTVHVIFEPDGSGIELQQRSLNSSRDWITVCKGKCREELLLRADYRIAGARSAGVFKLHGRPNDTIVLTAETHSRALFALGITTTSIGGLLLLVSADAAAQCSNEGSCGSSGPIVGFVVGTAIATAAGMVMIATNPKSKVFQHVASSVGLGAKNSTVLAHAPIATASQRPQNDASFHFLAPQFAPPARTSSLFTIHF